MYFNNTMYDRRYILLTDYLESIDIDLFIVNSEKFLSIDLSKCNDDYIVREFNTVMNMEKTVSDILPTFYISEIIPLYRTRLLKETDMPLDLTESNFREPPLEKYNLSNRFQITDKSQLYMSLGDGITYPECKVDSGDYYALSTLVNTETISVKGIGPMFDNLILKKVNLTDKQFKKYKIIMDFVSQILTISKYDEVINHKISTIILEDLLMEIPDCFLYPSIHAVSEFEQYNVVSFRPEKFSIHYVLFKQFGTEKIFGALPVGNGLLRVSEDIQAICRRRHDSVQKWYSDMGAYSVEYSSFIEDMKKYASF